MTATRHVPRWYVASMATLAASFALMLALKACSVLVVAGPKFETSPYILRHEAYRRRLHETRAW